MIDQEDSFTDLLDDDVRYDTFELISNQLFDDWNDANLNEGLMYADFKIAQMSGDTDIINAFHEHWGIGPNDEYWLGD